MRLWRRKPEERPVPEAAIWQDVEFGAYTADLPLWEELATEAGGSVIELGAGSGRVAMHLAKAGRYVFALERDPELVEELQRRARAANVTMTSLAVELGDLADGQVKVRLTGSWRSPPGLAIAPLHVIQQIPPSARAGLLASVASWIGRGGLLAAVVVDEDSLVYAEGVGPEGRPPDMREIDGWVYSSEPLWLHLSEDELKARRLRRRVSPGGDIERTVHDEVLNRLSPDELESEARGAGFLQAGRRAIRSGPGEASSVAVLLEVTDGG